MPTNPVEFMRRLANNTLQRCGNRVQLEDGTGTVIGTLPVSVADGADAAQGAQTDAEAAGDGSVIAILKRIRTLLAAGLPAALSSAGRLTVDHEWRVALISDEALNDSDKIVYTVPADTEAEVLWIWVEYTSTAAAGVRQLVIQIQDIANDAIGDLARAGITHPASQAYFYQFGPGLADLTAIRDGNYLTTPIPPTTLLQAGDQVRVYDNNAVAVAADDMIVQMQIATRGV